MLTDENRRFLRSQIKVITVGVIIAVFSMLSNLEAYAHGGGLNAQGCHNNRKTGGYHCHRKQGGSKPLKSKLLKRVGIHEAEDRRAEERLRLVQERAYMSQERNLRFQEEEVRRLLAVREQEKTRGKLLESWRRFPQCVEYLLSGRQGGAVPKYGTMEWLQAEEQRLAQLRGSFSEAIELFPSVKNLPQNIQNMVFRAYEAGQDEQLMRLSRALAPPKKDLTALQKNLGSLLKNASREEQELVFRILRQRQDKKQVKKARKDPRVQFTEEWGRLYMIRHDPETGKIIRQDMGEAKKEEAWGEVAR